MIFYRKDTFLALENENPSIRSKVRHLADDLGINLDGPFQKQNTGSSLKQICALLVIYGIFQNSGNSKWNFSGNGHILSNLEIWDIFPTQF